MYFGSRSNLTSRETHKREKKGSGDGLQRMILDLDPVLVFWGVLNSSRTKFRWTLTKSDWLRIRMKRCSSTNRLLVLRGATLTHSRILWGKYSSKPIKPFQMSMKWDHLKWSSLLTSQKSQQKLFSVLIRESRKESMIILWTTMRNCSSSKISRVLMSVRSKGKEHWAKRGNLQEKKC